MMRSARLLAIFILLTVRAGTAGAAPKKPALNNGNRWVCYYGASLEPAFFSSLDLAIVDPDVFVAPATIKKPVMIGYVSIGEVEDYRWYWPKIKGSDWVVEPNANWPGNYYVDIRSDKWRSLLLDEIIPKILAAGYQGLFLDTLDTAFYLEQKDPKRYAGSVDALTDFIKDLRKKYPDTALITNNALPSINAWAPWIDGALVEDLYTHYDFAAKTYARTDPTLSEEKEEELKKFLTVHKKPVFALHYADSQEFPREAVDRSTKHGFFSYIATVSLTEVGVPETKESIMPRKILGIFDLSRDARKKIRSNGKPQTSVFSYYSDLHKAAEMPLNHLGLEVVLHDIEDQLPPLDQLTGFHGVVTWLSGQHSVTDPKSYCRWLSAAIDNGLNVVILGQPGFPLSSSDSPSPQPACDEMLAKLGVSIKKETEYEPISLKIRKKNTSMVEFERKLTLREIERMFLLTPRAGATSHLQLEIQEAARITSDPVVTTAHGGVALDPFVLYENFELESPQRRWRLNPFLFFETALGLAGWPRPDTTTLNGRRLTYNHVDGDGFFNVSEVDRKTWSGRVFLNEILKAHPTVPFTISLITAYYEINRYKTDAAMALSKEVMTRPNVAPASHGFAHPLNWRKETVAVKLPGATFDAHKEIVGSIEFINREILAQRNPTSLFLWTGDCLPEEEHLRLISDNKLLNMNGGDSRFDHHFNSLSYVAPLGRLVGAHRQIYSSNSNENIYTNLWQGPYYGYRDVIETFENTESPRRLKPVNVYVHFYSAEKIASLQVLKETLAWAGAQNLFAILAVDYVQIVRSFFEMQITRVDSHHFRFKNGRNIRTIRFDNDNRYPDLPRSSGVLGYQHFQGSLYVFLDESSSRALVLTSKKPQTPHLLEANGFISNWKSSQDRLQFRWTGWGLAEIRLGGLKPNIRTTTVVEARRLRHATDADGRLELKIPGGPDHDKQITVFVETAL